MKPLQVIQEKKTELFKNLVLVVLLSVGVSLLANYLSTSYPSSRCLLWISIACILLVSIIYVISFYKGKSFVVETESLFIVDNNGNPIVIPRYTMNEDMNRAIKSVFSENKTLMQLWKDSFVKSSIRVKDTFYMSDYPPMGEKIVCFVGEVVEYVFIHKLSLKQSSYFNSFDESNLEILKREDIADYLLKNRVLEMISKPYDQRDKFTSGQDDRQGPGKVVAIYSDGAVYSLFDLKMPKKTSMSKKGKKLIIKNRNYTLKFTHNYQGFSGNTATKFSQLYLGKDFDDIRTFIFKPRLEIKLNPFFFLFWKDWKYMKWIDTICEEFYNYFSFEEFLNDIGYETALTIVLTGKNLTKKASGVKEKPDEKKGKIEKIEIVQDDYLE